MRKPVYLALLGISIVVAAVSLGVSLTRYLGMRAYSPKGTAQAASAPAGRVVPAAPLEQWNNLFAPGDGMKLASRLPAVNAKGAAQAPRSMFVLVGTIVSSTASARRAILWTNGMKEPKAFREKEEVEPGAILASVERDKVWIRRGAEREKLEILSVGSRGRPTATAPPAAASPVAAAVPLPALPTDASAAPWAAPGLRTPPEKAPAMAAPVKPSGEEEDDNLTPRQRRSRAKSLRR